METQSTHRPVNITKQAKAVEPTVEQFITQELRWGVKILEHSRQEVDMFKLAKVTGLPLDLVEEATREYYGRLDDDAIMRADVTADGEAVIQDLAQRTRRSELQWLDIALQELGTLQRCTDHCISNDRGTLTAEISRESMDILRALARLTGTHEGSTLDRILLSVGAILAPFVQLKEPRRDPEAQTVYLIRRDYRPTVRQDGSLWVELHGDIAAMTLSALKRNSGEGYSSQPVHSMAELREATKSLQPMPTTYSTWREGQARPLAELFV